MHDRRVNRRDLIIATTVGAAAASLPGFTPRLFAENAAPLDAEATEGARKVADLLARITDPEIKAGATAAIQRNLVSAATEREYPGHFMISADGSAYGPDSTFPGLDSWQMASAYLLMGRTRMVLDYFDFVRASQRKDDGNIPWIIMPGSTRPDTSWLSGLHYPEDLFTYEPPQRTGIPESAMKTKQWMRLFGHWQPKARPLSNLGAVCYVLTAVDIFAHTKSQPWLRERMPSIESAAKYLLNRKSAGNGLIAGSGFYTELPPRHGYDGVNQCYCIHVFRNLAKLFTSIDDRASASTWTTHADALTKSFTDTFWRDDHFAEYVHIGRGLIDTHGLSDTNWAAIAFHVATDAQAEKLWPLLTSSGGGDEPHPTKHTTAAPAATFWAGGVVPTLTVTRPLSYAPWEYHEKLPFGAPPLKDASAMGRVWHLEVEACRRMNDTQRIVESARRVSQAAKDGYWPERYTVDAKGNVTRFGPEKYCEYPAVLARTVLSMPEAFCVS